uniref:Palmitoyltransferase n=1 Tax=Catagonus wagneri TaxID=51154 RepID=A0A8C3X181_9CETA
MQGQQNLLLGPARLCLNLLLLLGYRRRCPPVLQGLVQRWHYGKVCLRSLLYSYFRGSDTAVDGAFEPICLLVDNVIRWCGLVFMVLVTVLTSSIVATTYLCVLPLILQTYSVPQLCWHFFCSHWNLILIIFYYYQAVTTPPGYPPRGRNDITTVSVCQKCINRKLAQTHDYSICNRCVLKMDHHCPWLNNCSLFYLWFLCSSMAFALAALTLWHAVLISRGESSINRHIKKELQAKDRVFRNHYNYGSHSASLMAVRAAACQPQLEHHPACRIVSRASKDSFLESLSKKSQWACLRVPHRGSLWTSLLTTAEARQDVEKS